MIIIKLAAKMKEEGYNISTLAIAAGLHRNGISKILNGKNNGIEYDTLSKLCAALKCNVQDIIEYVEDKNTAHE